MQKKSLIHSSSLLLGTGLCLYIFKRTEHTSVVSIPLKARFQNALLFLSVRADMTEKSTIRAMKRLFSGFKLKDNRGIERSPNRESDLLSEMDIDKEDEAIDTHFSRVA